jgi:hypothetical protein
MNFFRRGDVVDYVDLFVSRNWYEFMARRDKMPRRARLDASETLHHVIVRGIERHQQKADEFMPRICEDKNVPIEELKGGRRRKEASRVRGRMAIGLKKTYGLA